MFETFDVPALYLGQSSALSLRVFNISTGVVIECGDGYCAVVPIYEGFVISSAVQRTNIAGSDLTANLIQLMRERGITICSPGDPVEFADQIKEYFTRFNNRNS